MAEKAKDRLDPEDGITAEVNRLLAARDNLSIKTWRALWKALFPEDRIIPSSGKTFVTLHLL